MRRAFVLLMLCFAVLVAGCRGRGTDVPFDPKHPEAAAKALPAFADAAPEKQPDAE